MANPATDTEVLLKDIADGRVVLFLGAGVNLCGRPDGQAARRGEYLPSGGELAALLAERYGYPGAPSASDLTRIAQYVHAVKGGGPLYAELRELFNADYQPTAVHTSIARLPKRLRERGYQETANQVVVTTNWDVVLERAFREADEPYDLVTYIATGPDAGKFWHVPWDEAPRLVVRPNKYGKLRLSDRTVILKIHGTVSREDRDRDSYVITEDDYIDYSTRTDLGSMLPVELAKRLKNSHFLFLGYRLSDWNLRIIFHRIWSEQTLRWNSWAVQKDASELDQKLWEKRNVTVTNQDLAGFVGLVEKALESLPVRSET